MKSWEIFELLSIEAEWTFRKFECALYGRCIITKLGVFHICYKSEISRRLLPNSRRIKKYIVSPNTPYYDYIKFLEMQTGTRVGQHFDTSLLSVHFEYRFFLRKKKQEVSFEELYKMHSFIEIQSRGEASKNGKCYHAG